MIDLSKYPDLQFRKRRGGTGIVEVKLRTPHGIQWITTGATTHVEARKVCTESVVAELQAAASANALTADVISRLTTGRRFTMMDILDCWKTHMNDRNVSPLTTAGYERTLTQFIADTASGKQPISFIKRGTLTEFVNFRRANLAARRSRLSALRSFYEFANHAGYCVGNLAKLCEVKTRDLLIAFRETQPITPDEYQRIVTSPKTPAFWRCAAAFGYWLGYRISDCAGLRWDSILGDKIVIIVLKTQRKLELDLSDPLLGSGELRGVLLGLLSQPPNGSPYCFPTEQAILATPSRRAWLSYYFVRIIKRIGIQGRSFHSLRHGFAMRLRAAGWEMDDVRAAMGHWKQDTTRIYTEHEPVREGATA